MKRILYLLFWLLVLAGGACAEEPWFSRVLVVNDDGIDDPRLAALVHAFAKVADVVVVAPLKNCSGSTNYISAFQKKELVVEQWELGEGIEVWGVDGFPGDCVLLALTGLMKDNPPDLVVSGVNSGPNLADAYLASGTIGAARVAAQHGVPAIAFSNLDPEDPSMMTAVPEWCVRLTSSEAVSTMTEGQYLTVNFPDGPADGIKGVQWAPPGEKVFHDVFDPGRKDSKGRRTWHLRWWFDDGDYQPEDGDVSLQRSGWITVTPMRLGDLNNSRLEAGGSLPSWPVAE